MGFTDIPVFASAVFLGLTHALEPDHIAGISAVVTDSTNSRIATLTGSAFGAGHALLVCGWIGFWYLFDGGSMVPMWMDELGTTLVALLLASLATALGIIGIRRLIHRHDHVHNTQAHAHFHVHFPFLPHERASHGHGHSTVDYLKMGVLGALFTLSPPLSMVVFLATILPAVDATVIGIAVGVYSITIISAMGAIGFGVGRVTDRIGSYGERVHAGLQIVTAFFLLAVAVHVVLPIL